MLVYGGAKNYLGHDKTASDNLYLFPDVKPTWDALLAVTAALDLCSGSGVDLPYGGIYKNLFLSRIH